MYFHTTSIFIRFVVITYFELFYMFIKNVYSHCTVKNTETKIPETQT